MEIFCDMGVIDVVSGMLRTNSYVESFGEGRIEVLSDHNFIEIDSTLYQKS